MAANNDEPTVLESMITAFQVDWRSVNQRLRSHPHEARTLTSHGKRGVGQEHALTSSTLLHLALQRRRSNYPPLQTLRLWLAIFPAAAWVGVENCTSPLHLVAMYNPRAEYLALCKHARPAVPQDMKALLSLWDYHIHAIGGGSEQALVAFLTEGSREAARVYVELVGLVEYTQTTPLRPVQYWLHTVAAQTADLALLDMAVEVFQDKTQSLDEEGRLPLHAFLATKAGGRPLTLDDEIIKSSFRFPFDLLPLLRLLVRSCPTAVTTRDARGQLPLHVAIQAGWDEFDVLLADYPDSLQAVDGKTGLFPFELAAVSPDSSLDTVYHLLRRNPSVLQTAARGSAETVDAVGATSRNNDTLRNSCHCKRGASGDLMRLAFRVGEAECAGLWKSLQVLLTDRSTSHKRPTLHLLAGLPHCPKGFFQAMTHFHYPELRSADSMGRLPLHWLAKTARQEEQDYIDQGDADETCPYLDRLDYLLQMDPSACSHRDDNGCLPLHVAATGSMSWQGLQRLVDACPQALRESDGITNLSPVLAGAQTMNLSEIYLLLTTAPDVIDPRLQQSRTK